MRLYTCYVHSNYRPYLRWTPADLLTCVCVCVCLWVCTSMSVCMTYVHGIIDFRTYFAVVARVAYVGGSDITLKTNKISRRGIIIIVFRFFWRLFRPISCYRAELIMRVNKIWLKLPSNHDYGNRHDSMFFCEEKKLLVISIDLGIRHVFLTKAHHVNDNRLGFNRNKIQIAFILRI